MISASLISGSRKRHMKPTYDMQLPIHFTVLTVSWLSSNRNDVQQYHPRLIIVISIITIIAATKRNMTSWCSCWHTSLLLHARRLVILSVCLLKQAMRCVLTWNGNQAIRNPGCSPKTGLFWSCDIETDRSNKKYQQVLLIFDCFYSLNF